MKNASLSFTCLWLHFTGEVFAPVDTGSGFELQSDNSVLAGSSGNAFNFASEVNAMFWLNSNLLRSSKQGITSEQHIDALIVKNSMGLRDYITAEIETLNNKNNGTWFTASVVLVWEKKLND